MDERAFFDKAFCALTGYAPMSWQRRLFLEHFLRGAVPRALDLPTGLGKTSVMAIWLLALEVRLCVFVEFQLVISV